MQSEIGANDRGFLASAAGRMTFWGPSITGILGIVLAFNAALSDEYVGAGACLAASALAFGVIVYGHSRR